ncbi:Hypothetical_protein [Hexamita inflata]|uniref:Hypothetical_protein n=1 Tax=Hexamita inflata TaxID=28002 RepID=A0AA86PY54_9EUKA|nr:Hypothetical protein HINF_LOCUS30772 [Hexamita inflata]
MFKYTQVDDYLQIAPYCGSDCQNNLSQFFSKSFTQVKIQGNDRNKKLEFILQSYQTNIQSMIIQNCVVDLSKASGDFINVSFSGCELINDFTDQFRAVSLTFNQSVQISQLKNCYVQKLNIYANSKCKIDFEGAKQIQKLNELIIQAADVDLNTLQGTWNIVKLERCTVKNTFCDKFDSKQLQITSNDQNVLQNLQNFGFNTLEIIIVYNRELFDQKLFEKIQFKQIKLTLNNMKVDMQQLTGRFDELTLNQCVLLNYGTQKLSCQQLNVSDCKQHLVSFSTNIFHKINCKSLKIQQCAVVDYLPLNLQELHVKNCEVKLKNKCQHLQKISLNYVNKIQQIDMSLLPNLVEITSEHSYKCDVAQHIQNVIKMRQKFQKMQQTNVKRIEKLTVKRETQYQNLDELDDEFFYCFDVILDNFEGGTE